MAQPWYTQPLVPLLPLPPLLARAPYLLFQEPRSIVTAWPLFSQPVESLLNPQCQCSCLLLLLLSRFSRVRLCDPIDGSPPGSPRPWDSPGKNTGVGCHFLLRCMKVKGEVAQSCPTLSDPMDCSLPGSFIHGILQARVLEWGAIAFSECSCLVLS